MYVLTTARRNVRRYTVVEREGKLLACAMLRPLGQGPDGVSCAELAAFCVHSAYRGSGRGDSLLDFLGVSRHGQAQFLFIPARSPNVSSIPAG